MTKINSLSRPAASAITALMVLSTPTAFAQEAPVTAPAAPITPMTLPVAPTTAPASTAPPPAESPAPQPVIRVPIDIAPAPTVKKEASKAPATPTKLRRTAPPMVAEKTALQAERQPASDAAEAAPIIERAPAVPSVPVVPAIEAAPATQREEANDDSFSWQIAGGAAALLLVGGIGLTLLRRPRAANEVWEFDEAPGDTEWIPGAAVSARRDPHAAASDAPALYSPGQTSIGRHEAMAMMGPTPDNPFATLQKRLSRARFLDRRERAQYQATLASQKDYRRKPVSAWEVSQRPMPAQPAEQDIRRLEPGRASKALKPGWTRS